MPGLLGDEFVAEALCVVPSEGLTSRRARAYLPFFVFAAFGPSVPWRTRASASSQYVLIRESWVRLRRLSKGWIARSVPSSGSSRTTRWATSAG